MRKIMWSVALAGGAWYILENVLPTFEPAYGEIVQWVVVVVIGLVGWVAASPRLGKDAALILAELKVSSGGTVSELMSRLNWDQGRVTSALTELQSYLGDQLQNNTRAGRTNYYLKSKKPR